MASHPAHDRTRLGGCPGYVQGWCCKARDRTLARGYRDVGYLLAPKLRRFRPPHVAPPTWSSLVRRLRGFLESGDEPAALAWFATAYPRLMAVIPKDEHREFLAGVRERRRS